MSRRKTSKKGPNPFALLILFAIAFLNKYWKIVVPIALLVVVICFVCLYIVRRKRKQKEELNSSAWNETDEKQKIEDTTPAYSARDSIMTDCERSFFETMKEIVEPSYMIQPQVNLASVINKESHYRYRNELFRNIDFGIFDRQYRLILLVEINDKSHENRERKERDKKVKAICNEANIPLITFWTTYGVNREYIKQRLSEYLTLPVDKMP